MGSDGQQVIIYRGINQSVAGLHLSSTYQRTGIPVSHVQGSLAASCRPPRARLAEAQHTVLNIRTDLQLQAGWHRGSELGGEQAQAVTEPVDEQGDRQVIQDQPVQVDEQAQQRHQ